jgi:hypothetical protein
MRIYDILPQGTPPEEYFAKDRLSKSTLDMFWRDPMEYYIKKLRPDRIPDDTKQMRFGRLAHCAIFERDELPKRYYLFDDVKLREKIGGSKPTTTNEYKAELSTAEYEAAKSDTVIVLKSDFTTTELMRAAMDKHPLAKALIEHDGFAEYKVLWDIELPHLEYTVGMKSMLDKFIPVCNINIPRLKGKRVVVDYKTCDDLSNKGIAKSCHNLRYDVQEALYLDSVGADVFIFIFQEKKFPFRVKTIELERSRIEMARLDYMDDIETALYHLDLWEETQDVSAFYSKGYSEIQQLTLPNWSRT